MASISVYDARMALSQLIDRVLKGEEIVITRRGKPVVKLIPAAEEPPRRRRLGLLKGKFEVPDSFFDPLPDDMIEAMMDGGPDDLVMAALRELEKR